MCLGLPAGRQVCGGGNYLDGHVPFVRLEHKMRNDEQEIICPVHSKGFERELLFGSQFFYAPVYKFVGAPLM